MKIAKCNFGMSIAWLITLGIFLSLAGYGYCNEFTVTIGKNKVFTSCNYHFTEKKVAPYHPGQGCPTVIEATSEGQQATAHVRAGPYQEGVARAHVGAWFLVEEASAGAQEEEAEISILLSYELDVDLNVPPPAEEGGGSADTIVYGINSGNISLVDRIHFIAYSNQGHKSGIRALNFQAALKSGQTYEVFLEAYAYGNVCIGGYADSYARVTVEEVKITFAPKSKEPPREKITTVAEPINIADGNMFISADDFSIPARNKPLALSRTYNSRDDYNGPFGYGWRSNYDIVLTEQPDGTVLEIDEDGVWTYYISNGDGTYTPSAGKHSVLIKNTDDSFTLTRKHGTVLSFDSEGNLTGIEDRNGNQTQILYDDGVLSTVINASGRKLIFTHNDQNRIIEAEDPAGRLFTYEYEQGNLIKATDPLGNHTTYQYDENHNLIVLTDSNGYGLYFEHDAEDRAYHSWQDAGNNEVILEFDPDNQVTIAKDSKGSETRYEYNVYGLVTRIVDAQGNVQETTWDGDMNQTSITDKNGHTTEFAYDTKGNLLAVTDSLLSTTEFTYEPTYNFVTNIIDPLSNQTQYSYDEQGNLIQIIVPLANITNYAYDGYGSLISITDANNDTTTFSYNEYGNVTTITDPLGNQTMFTYDLVGNPISITDARANTTIFTYDGLNRVAQITYPDNSKTSYVYDGVGNLTSVTDPNSHTTVYTYDEVNRLSQVRDPLNNLTIYTYDTESNRTTFTDANGNATTYLYDNLNRLIKTITPLGKEIAYTYDPVGNRLSTLDANGNSINYTYDACNKLTQIAYPDNTTVSFSYDANGRRIEMSDSLGTTTYTYDELNRLTEIDGPELADSITYTYDAVGNRISMTNQNSQTTSYTYDKLNRLISLTDSQGKTTSYSYDEASNLVRMAYPNHTLAKYTYDSLNRLVTLVNEKTGYWEKNNIISSYSYEYDPAGMRTKVTFEDGSRIEYTYDELNRLTSETKKGRYGKHKDKTSYKYEYTFDAVGNRTEMQATYDHNLHQLSFITQYSYDDDNRLLSSEDKTLFPFHTKGRLVGGLRHRRPTKSTAYQYDDNGNQISKTVSVDKGWFPECNGWEGTTNYKYNYENRLIEINYSQPSLPPISPPSRRRPWLPKEWEKVETTKYIYDGLGKRVREANDGETIIYLYDGLNVIIEKDQDNETLATYARGLSYAGGIGSIISAKKEFPGKRGLPKGFDVYYHYDGLASVTSLTDQRGHKIAAYTYDAYGNISDQSGLTFTNPYYFSTKEYSPQLGLIYFGARYYDPRIGRWITSDPLGIADGPNLYAYVGNNPINWIDPWGLCKDEPWWQERWDWWSKKLTPEPDTFWDEFWKIVYERNVPGISYTYFFISQSRNFSGEEITSGQIGSIVGFNILDIPIPVGELVSESKLSRTTEITISPFTGKHLGIGIEFSRTELGRIKNVRIIPHIGIGFGLPITISGRDY